MKTLRIFFSALALGILFAGSTVAEDTQTWAATLQQGIDSLELSDEQKTAISGAFDGADAAYAEAIGAARTQIGAILTDEQKTGLANMADAEIQKRLAGDVSARTKSIADIAGDLGVTEEQSSAIGQALSGLGGMLDGIDSELLSTIKSILNEEQLAKIASRL